MLYGLRRRAMRPCARDRTRGVPWLAVALLALAAGLPLPSHAQSVPGVPTPIENGWTPGKYLLGKILFWDQQLSSDYTIACGSCHAIGAAGGEADPAVHPGADGQFATADDVLGSRGVRRRDVNLALVDDPVFGFAQQVTPRASPNFFGGIWAPLVLHDGRAEDEFRDPLTGDVAAATGASLESQSLLPILNDVEMSKEGRTWQDVVDRLAISPPLRLATNLPPDVAGAIAIHGDYPGLFASAFGDPAITPVRIAFALATYERTLLAVFTPWDDFVAGNPTAMTPLEIEGWNVFDAHECAICHAPPLFTDNSFRTISVRPPSEDLGREAITGDPADRGAFKVPTLRNVGLKTNLLHTGEFATVAEVLDFYRPAHQGDPLLENQDPLMPVPLNTEERIAVEAFLVGGLTDDRVADERPPFDRPTLAPVPVPEPARGLAIAVGCAALVAAQRVRRDRTRGVARV